MHLWGKYHWDPLRFLGVGTKSMTFRSLTGAKVAKVACSLPYIEGSRAHFRHIFATHPLHFASASMLQTYLSLAPLLIACKVTQNRSKPLFMGFQVPARHDYLMPRLPPTEIHPKPSYDSLILAPICDETIGVSVLNLFPSPYTS